MRGGRVNPGRRFDPGMGETMSELDIEAVVHSIIDNVNQADGTVVIRKRSTALRRGGTALISALLAMGHQYRVAGFHDAAEELCHQAERTQLWLNDVLRAVEDAERTMSVAEQLQGALDHAYNHGR